MRRESLSVLLVMAMAVGFATLVLAGIAAYCYLVVWLIGLLAS